MALHALFAPALAQIEAKWPTLSPKIESENVKVRRALIAKGLKPLRVKHGRGTARGWLHVTVEGPDAFLLPCECPEWATLGNSHVAPCPKVAAQEEAHRLTSLARTAIHEATGRDSSKDDPQSDYNESNYLIFVKPLISWKPEA